MNSEPPESNTSDPESSAPGIGSLIQERALKGLERANAKPYRSPRRILLTMLAVIVTMSLFLSLMDAGVKVTHRVIDIWAPVIFDSKKPVAKSQKPVTDPTAPYMIKVEPSMSQSSAQTSSASSQRTK